MKVFKFGGASVKDAYSLKNIASVLSLHKEDSLVVVVSAMGKMTNALEQLLEDYFHKRNSKNEKLDTIKTFHKNIMDALFPANHKVYAQVDLLYSALEKKISLPVSEEYDYEYDQIVPYGELISSRIVNAYLKDSGLTSKWMDAREFIKTDNSYRDAKIDWELSGELTCQAIIPYLRGTNGDKRNIILTQGFIGTAEDDTMSTLGREGSDYSAAILAYLLKAESVTIWKDVPGVLNADPKWLADAIKLDEISYREAIELAYYGASVIHPKTIKPLENAGIPLYVKCFLDPKLSGTEISPTSVIQLPTPVFIRKQNQVLISISPRDFSFIVEKNLSLIFARMARYSVKANLMQNSAISFSICVDNDKYRIPKLIADLQNEFKVKYNDELELFTIRHYTDESVKRVANGRKILLEQKSRYTLQLVVK
ncbi:MAG: aspartate kinase [Bacteroidota bacterium]